MVPDSRLEGPGFESWCRQVGGSALIQPLCRNLANFGRWPLPTRTGQPITPACKVQQNHGPQSPATQIIVHDQGGGSGQLVLHAGGANNLWVKKSRRKRVSRLKIATYKVRPLLRDEHIQELKEELRETRLEWDVIGIGEVRRREECFTTLQNGDNKQRMKYAEIYKTIKKKVRRRKYNQENNNGIKEPEGSLKVAQDRLIPLLDKQGREIHNQDKIIE